MLRLYEKRKYTIPRIFFYLCFYSLFLNHHIPIFVFLLYTSILFFTFSYLIFFMLLHLRLNFHSRITFSHAPSILLLLRLQVSESQNHTTSPKRVQGIVVQSVRLTCLKIADNTNPASSGFPVLHIVNNVDSLE